MDRRTFVRLSLVGLFAVPLAAEAQTTPPLIGFLSGFSESTGPSHPVVRAFQDGLRDLGRVPGQNVRVEYRWSGGKHERLEALAAELVHLHPSVIVANSGPAALAAKRATATVPIVFETLGDPVVTGLVTSLSRPGANLTGLAGISAELSGKRLELLREMVPGLTRVGLLINSGNVMASSIIEETERAGRALNISIHRAEVTTPEQLPAAFTGIVRARAGALFVLPDQMLASQQPRILDLAARYRLPAIYVESHWAPAGGLATYAPSLIGQYRRAAYFVNRILRGAKPGDLPVEQPTSYELVINLKTAKALGLTIPQSVLLRADQVIE